MTALASRVTAPPRRARRVLLYLPMAILVVAIGAAFLLSRHPVGAASPRAAAETAMTALEQRDRSQLADVIGPDVANRDQVIDAMMSRYGGRLSRVQIALRPTENTGNFMVTITGEVDGRPLQLDSMVTRTRNHWYLLELT